jgi:hypothetical protein
MRRFPPMKALVEQVQQMPTAQVVACHRRPVQLGAEKG